MDDDNAEDEDDEDNNVEVNVEGGDCDATAAVADDALGDDAAP